MKEAKKKCVSDSISTIKAGIGQVFVKHRCFSLCSTRKWRPLCVMQSPLNHSLFNSHKPKTPKSQPKQHRSGKPKLLPSPDPHSFRAMFPFPGPRTLLFVSSPLLFYAQTLVYSTMCPQACLTPKQCFQFYAR